MSRGILCTILVMLFCSSIPSFSAGNEQEFLSGDTPASELSSPAVYPADSGPQRSGWHGTADAGSQERNSTKGQIQDDLQRRTGDPADRLPQWYETAKLPDGLDFDLLSHDPLARLRLTNIKPLYQSPTIPGEGVWVCANMPKDPEGLPIFFTTVYRPSVNFPNAIVYMMVVDLKRAFMQYYVGSQEPAASSALSEVEPALRSRLISVTNAMWMQRHSSGAGAIFRGKVLYPMVDGMATLIIYKDGSADIREWSSDIPVHLVRDARQLRHLIVKDGLVVDSIIKEGRVEDGEIGLGFLLGGGGKSLDGNHFWYIAHRSAFGIRPDGNLVFAIGHHIGTKDLGKALVLAGCVRAIHADANPHNIVGNFYLRDPQGKLIRKVRLSPEQRKYTLKRYDDSYTKDFFAFFTRQISSAANQAKTPKKRQARSLQ